MVSIRGQLWKAILGIPVQETQVSRRGFSTLNETMSDRIEKIGREFLNGYHIALEERTSVLITSRITAASELEFQGFNFEGAAMALTLLDHLTLPGRRFQAFLDGPGAPHAYMCFIGAGWAIARLPWLRARPDRVLREMDPLLCWLAIDGYGFHEGYFHWPRCVTGAEIPRQLRGYQLRAFDQGLGRSLWFVYGVDPIRIAGAIASFPAVRRSDLWSGVGLACAYAGEASTDAVQSLLYSAAAHLPAFLQGIAFAVKARHRAGNLTANARTVCSLACGVSAEDVAGITDETAKNLPVNGALPAYEVWRSRLQCELARAQGRSFSSKGQGSVRRQV